MLMSEWPEFMLPEEKFENKFQTVMVVSNPQTVLNHLGADNDKKRTKRLCF